MSKKSNKKTSLASALFSKVGGAYFGNNPPKSAPAGQQWVKTKTRNKQGTPLWRLSGTAAPTPAPTPAAAPAPTPTAPTQQNTYNPTPLVPDVQPEPSLTIQSPEPELTQAQPELPAPQYLAGGAGADVGSNAAGFRRKKSSAKMAGLTSKGTSQFKIGGQSARSSGLNIGI